MLKLFRDIPLTDKSVGLPVYAQDGRQLGAVAEIRGYYFMIEKRGVQSYWLARDHVGAETESGVLLALRPDAVPDYAIEDVTEYEPTPTAKAA